jgi:hypothetical protein
MKDKLRIAKIVALVLIIVAAAAFLHYNLPRAAVVTIQGTDVKRMDASGSLAKNPNRAGTRDVRFINTVRKNNRVLVLRNEDTGWGWPPYFKFNSADLVAQAQAFANENPPPTVLITYYGWRIQLFSLYPNIIRMRAVAPDYSHFPWFNIIFLILLTAALLYMRVKVKRTYNRVRARFFKKQAPPSDAGDDSRP